MSTGERDCGLEDDFGVPVIGLGQKMDVYSSSAGRVSNVPFLLSEDRGEEKDEERDVSWPYRGLHSW